MALPSTIVIKIGKFLWTTMWHQIMLQFAPGNETTCDLEKIKQDYYGNLFPLNPGGIIPNGSRQEDLLLPHNRENIKLSSLKD